MRKILCMIFWLWRFYGKKLESNARDFDVERCKCEAKRRKYSETLNIMLKTSGNVRKHQATRTLNIL